jgi:hypothetical protein
MTLSATTNRVAYSGDGSTTSFPVTFIYWEDTTVKVILSNDTTGVETTWTAGTQYNLTGGDGAIGTLAIDTSPTDYTPASGETLTIKSNHPYTQTTALPLGGPLPSTTIEDRLDKNVRLTQQNKEELNRTIQFSESSAMDSLGIDDPIALNMLRWNAAGNSVESVALAALSMGAFQGDWAASTAYSVRDIVKDTSNNNIYIVLTSHTSSGVQPISTNTDVAKWALLVDAASATASAAAAAADELLTRADTVLTAADVVLTNADVVLTNADVVLTNADVVLTGNDVTSTNADVVLTNADVVTTGGIAGAVALPYIFNTTTTMADPAGTFFRLNSATPASVTAISFGDTTSDAVDLSAWLADWADSTSTLTGTIRIVQQGTPAKTIVFNVTAVTDNTDWLQVTVAHVSGTSLFTSASTCRVTFTRTGDKGDTGATGLTGATGSQGAPGISPGLPFRFNSTTNDADKDAGDFWYNAAVGSATILYIDDADTNGNAVAGITDTWDDNGSATHRGLLYVKQVVDSSNLSSFKVTGSIVDATGYSKLTVELLGTFGTIADNDLCLIEFSATGTGGIANRTVDLMTGDASDTTLVLSQAPGSENNVTVTLDGVTQHHDTYSLSGSTITFSTAPALGVKVEAVSGGLESIGTPSDGTVTLAKMAVNSIDSDQYVDGSIDLAHMSVNSIDSDQYVDGSIDAAHMSANSVDSDQYVDGSIDVAHMSANSVDSDQYVDGSIDVAHMSANSVDSDQYVDGSIDSEHLATGVILNDVLLKDYGEVTNAIGSAGGTRTVDLTLGNSVTATVSASTNTFVFSNPTASDELCSFSLMLTNGGSQTVAWPATVDWAAATPPTLTASGVDCLVFWTVDGGTIWNGSTVALNLS